MYVCEGLRVFVFICLCVACMCLIKRFWFFYVRMSKYVRLCCSVFQPCVCIFVYVILSSGLS